MFAQLVTSLRKVQRDESSVELEKMSFIVKKGIVLGHAISDKGIKMDKAKLISNLPSPRAMKEIRSFLRHAGF